MSKFVKTAIAAAMVMGVFSSVSALSLTALGGGAGETVTVTVPVAVRPLASRKV